MGREHIPPGTTLTNHEAAENSLRSRVVDTLRNKRQFVINPLPAGLGDLLITNAAYRVVLERICDEEKIPKKNIRITFQFDLGRRYLDLLGATSVDPEDQNTPTNAYQRMLYVFGKALDVPITQTDLDKVPEPRQFDYPPMDTFDRRTVMRDGKKLRQEILGRENRKYKQIIVLGQGGSFREKRFTDAQIQSLAIETRRKYPDAYIVVVTDNDNAENPPTPFVYQNDVNEVVGIDDINNEAKYFFAMDKLITTDSFNGWFGLGVRAMRNDRKGFIRPDDGIILYTAADPDIYFVLGSTAVVSKAVVAAKQQGVLAEEGVLDFGKYEGFANLAYGSPSKDIHPEDLQLVQNAIRLG